MLKKIMLLFFLVLIQIIYSCASNNSIRKPITSTSSSILVVSGKVFYPDGKPVPGASVSSEPPSMITNTNTEGHFVIDKGLVPGKYSFIADFNGVKGRINEAVVQYGDTLRVEIKLGANVRMHPVQDGSLEAGYSGGGSGVINKR